MDDWLSSERNYIVVFVFRSAALPNFYKEQSLCPRQLARGLPKLWGITLTRSKLWNFILPFLNSNIFNYQHLTFCTELLWGTLLWIITGSVEERKFFKKIIFFLKKWLHFNLSCVCQKTKIFYRATRHRQWLERLRIDLWCPISKNKEYSGCYFGKLELSFFPILAYSSSRRTMRTLKGSRGLLDPSLTFSQRQLSDLRRRGRR